MKSFEQNLHNRATNCICSFKILQKASYCLGFGSDGESTRAAEPAPKEGTQQGFALLSRKARSARTPPSPRVPLDLMSSHVCLAGSVRDAAYELWCSRRCVRWQGDAVPGPCPEGESQGDV